jgi:predicted transcriptional regulator
MASVEKVTVSLPAQVRQAAQQLAEATGQSFSAVVSSALESWMRGRLTDVWLSEHQAENGAFTEAELQALATDAGVPYLPPTRAGDAGRGSGA